MAQQSDTEGWCNLHHAVAGRFTNLIQSLLEQGGEEIINTPDGKGRTPLHLACSDIKGTDVPLFLKCDSEDLTCRTLTETEQIIELLLSHGADPQILDNNGKSPLHCLVVHWLVKQYPLEEIGKIITQFLHSRGNINVQDGNGRTLLHYVSGPPKMKVPVARIKSEEDLQIRIRRQMLFRRGGLERRVSFVGNFPENFAEYGHEGNVAENNAENGNIVKYTPEQELFWKQFLVKLLSFGADMNVADKLGNTPLHLAIVASKFELVKELLKGNSKINVRNTMGQTPLHHAVSDHERFKHCAILLMHKGALASITDIRGCTPVDIARDRRDFPCFLRHLILLINVKIHPEMHINTKNSPVDKAIKQNCMQECKDLNSYFELNGKSQLPVFLRYHSLPAYTQNVFFQMKINCDNFNNRFPNYSHFLKYKFSQDKNRREMIDKCMNVFSCFGGNFHYTSAGRLIYTRNSHWENLPGELKLKILSYLSNNDLEYLKKHLIV